MPTESLTSALRRSLRDLPAAFTGDGGAGRCAALRQLIEQGLAALTPPGSGRTLERWQALAEVAAHDLPLAKLFEGHTDALAILAEAGAPAPGPGAAWGMWAAEAPGARVIATQTTAGRCTLGGIKAWCSGARHLDRALLTAWGADGAGPFLAAVDLHQAGITFESGPWKAVGMTATDSHDVLFSDAAATLVGPARFYLDRPGFWQGGAGIAACWHGGACAIADVLRAQARAAPDAGWHRLVALGAVDRALAANAALLREAAGWIDAHPRADAKAVALRTRAAADAGAELVLHHATRALGATPLCRDASFARMAADLPVFVRQSHGDRDLAALGQCSLDAEAPSWRL